MSLILNSSGAFQMPNFLPVGTPGMGCIGMGCGCAGCGVSGLTMDGTGLFGTGLFADPFNLSSWGMGEYFALGLVAYTLYAVTSTTKAELHRARRGVRRVRAKFA